jgi:hypothetical protein
VPYADKIDALIETVRGLNHQVRPKLTNAVGGGEGASAQAHPVLGEMRDGELAAALTIQSMLAGDQGGRDEKYRVPLDQIGARSLLSEFTTAREATLASLRDLSDAQWEESRETANGTSSVKDVVDGLIESDKIAVARLQQIAGVETPPQAAAAPESTASPSTDPSTTESLTSVTPDLEPQGSASASSVPQSAAAQDIDSPGTEAAGTEPESTEPPSTQ